MLGPIGFVLAAIASLVGFWAYLEKVIGLQLQKFSNLKSKDTDKSFIDVIQKIFQDKA